MNHVFQFCVGRASGGKPKDCGDERLMWYSIIDVGLMLVISLEDFQEFAKKGDRQKNLKVQPHMEIHSLTGPIRLDLFAVVFYQTRHWMLLYKATWNQVWEPIPLLE